MNTAPEAYRTVESAVAPLNSRVVIKVTGEDATHFLQGLITNDIKLTETRTIYTGFLTHKSKLFVDAFVTNRGECYLVEISGDRADALLKHFKKYKLRAQVNFEVDEQTRVWCAISNNTKYMSDLVRKNCGPSVGYAFVDPRLDALGARIYIDRKYVPHVQHNFTPVGEDFYNMLSICNGIAPSICLEPERLNPMEANLDYFDAISFDKGCYLGQELIARTHSQGVVRKRIVPVRLLSDSEEDDLNFDHVSLDKPRGSRLFPTSLDTSLDIDCSEAPESRNCRLLMAHYNFGVALVKIDPFPKIVDTPLMATEESSFNGIQMYFPYWWHEIPTTTAKRGKTSEADS